ncbi:MAG: O-antigen ligase domain-containing protein [Methylacidiphilales bacterium]|nr:O-antigen ligase domain-containing protein [Candidatus Methylacidiphilales bacterium]NJR15199.1 O-antigen ligase domain-containing protein [Calothrix sp. CSU_2_0]
MTSHQSLYPSQSNIPPENSPLFAWISIGALMLFTAVAYLGAASILRQTFPILSFLVGIFLYLRYPTLYLGFTWWIWFLVPIIRRLIDYKSGWDTNGFILVTPFLVTLITFATFVRYLPKSTRIGALPFVIAAISVFYGIAVGLISFDKVLVFRTALDWITPVFFGFHILVNWRDYPKYRENTQKVFLWCVLITGSYGIYQYLVAPEWDKFWLIQTKLVTMGKPEPLGIRVWSTMHSSNPFANVMMVGLLLLLNSVRPIGFAASVVGYISFLLTVVRSAWGGWVVAVATLLTNLRPKFQMRLLVVAIVLMLSVVPLATIEPFGEVISDRFESISNLQKDQSFNDRSSSYDRKLGIALSSPFGNGIGGTWIIDRDGKLVNIVLDSGILDSFFALGWFGAIPYLGSMILLLFSMFQGSQTRSDTFACAARSISLGIFFQMGFGSMMLGLSGMTLWGFIAMAMAAKKYHQQQASNGLRH